MIADLSPSRLAHVFKDRVDIPLRSLRTWFRLKVATIWLRRGYSLTDAAVAAGFYDQAHFSHQFRKMFGIQPSLIFRGDAEVRWWIESEELTLRLADDVL